MAGVKPERVRDPEKIRELALTALERRRRTRSELSRILRRKGVRPADYDPILDRLTEVGLIDDLEYARVFIARRAASKPRGARLLRNELLVKGVAPDLIDTALDERDEEADPVDDALRALKPRIARLAALEPRDRKAKAWQYLARRGFSGDVIERAVRAMGKDLEADDFE